MANQEYDFGMIGLGTMGKNLLLNMADHGYAVAGFDLSADKAKAFEESGAAGQHLKGVHSLKDLVSCLKTPRKLMMLVPAGKAVDSVLNDLKPLLEKGDIIIDGGNSHFTDTLARIDEMKKTGIHFMGVGISGGEEGARRGPSMMAGGDKEAWDSVAKVLIDVSAKVGNNEPCVDYLGKGAAGHYVKMVHNGIEYAIMQLTGEVYDLLKHGVGANNHELGQMFSEWNAGEMKSYLLEITADIFKTKDDKSKESLVDMILDKAGALGTGKWTSQSALDLGMPIPTIDSAVSMRNISSLKDERLKAEKVYPMDYQQLDISKKDLERLLKDAFHFSTIIAYAQGLALISKASKDLNMEVPMEKAVKVWRGGCIIRSLLLNIFSDIYSKNPALENLLLNNDIAKTLTGTLPSVQKVIELAAKGNYPIPGIMTAFSYFNAYRRGQLPLNLIQAQRDYFGAHTYQRIDQEGIFHTSWKHFED